MSWLNDDYSKYGLIWLVWAALCGEADSSTRCCRSDKGDSHEELLLQQKVTAADAGRWQEERWDWWATHRHPSGQVWLHVCTRTAPKPSPLLSRTHCSSTPHKHKLTDWLAGWPCRNYTQNSNFSRNTDDPRTTGRSHDGLTAEWKTTFPQRQGFKGAKVTHDWFKFFSVKMKWSIGTFCVPVVFDSFCLLSGLSRAASHNCYQEISTHLCKQFGRLQEYIVAAAKKC